MASGSTSAAALRSALVLSTLVAATACTTLGASRTPPPAIYDLSAPKTFVPGPLRPVQLLLPAPTTTDALATARIAVRRADGSIAYFPDVSWADQLPALVQTSLARAFENSGRVKAVAKPGQGFAIDDRLLVDIRSFELDVRTGPSARVVLGASLMDDRTGKMKASRVFDVSRPARSDRPADAIAAMTDAADGAFRDVVEWAAGAL